jgi:hypothetical protein
MREAFLRTVGLVAVASALAIAGWSAWAYRGPYRWLAELQLSAFGSYEVQLTFLGTVLFFLVPCLFVVLPLRMAMGASSHEGTGIGISLAAWIQENRGSLVMGILAIVGFGGAAWFAVDAATLGALCTPDLASLEAGAVPPGRFVELRGVLRRDLAFSTSERDSTTHYVPVVSLFSGRPAVFLELSDWEASSPELDAGTYRGILHENGLPGTVRVELERMGAVADRHYTLDWRADADDRWAAAIVFGAIGAIGAVILAIIRVVTHLRSR